ncbi:MAG: TlpA family protein disulfide reductase [Bacteroidales bacterium]|nr:TlpA family protein disulfide reductase [Bacteroidales bacterium]
MKSAAGLIIIILFSVINSKAQDIKTVNFDDIETVFYKTDDTVRVINFWATWCIPCVEEMPYFTKAEQQYSDKKVKFIYVSLDFPRYLETKVIPFVKKHNMNGRLFLLDDPDANQWISQVDSRWSGALPATVVYRREQKTFKEGGITYKELNEFIKQKL